MRVSIEEACANLRSGKVVAIPTDTVYGLAADWKNPFAVQKIFSLKKRPDEKPLIFLFSHFSQIEPLISSLPPDFEQWKKYWPGALTVVLPVFAEKICPAILSGGTTAGFRMPNHPLLLKLIEQFGPLVAPSANLSAHSPALSAEEVEAVFGESFPVLDGGMCEVGVASTIISYEMKWKILRQGSIELPL